MYSLFFKANLIHFDLITIALLIKGVKSWGRVAGSKSRSRVVGKAVNGRTLKTFWEKKACYKKVYI